MNPSQRNKVIYLSLKYLNIDDLQKLGQVSRYWYNVTKSVKLMRDTTSCIVDELKFNQHLRWIFTDRHNTNHFNKIPCLQICFTNDKNDENLQSGCLSSIKPFHSFTINLKSYYNIRHGEEINPIRPITIPVEYFTELTTFSFIDHSRENEYSNEQIYLNYVNDKMNIHTLYSKFVQFCRFCNPKSIVIIIFCQSCYFLEFLDLMYAVSRRIAMFEITIWAVTIDALSICRFSLNKHYCRIDNKFLFIIINNPKLKTYVGFLDENCNNAHKIETELRKIKSKIELSSNSIALMHVSYSRLKEFYALDTSIFREVFPNIISAILTGRKRATMENINQLTSFILLSQDNSKE
ncbi:PREDICTED: uncharacterized protein LOC106789671 [Polistes canadensis]|uniref:uncharacterized protein LOC106789671 n=1 Tax=Polistes canadensis TaxID=91411 RepID=UPI000718F22F|nr:PREDICTED: uncharacterized protein LOC106789671 [Polistes canadensis]